MRKIKFTHGVKHLYFAGIIVCLITACSPSGKKGKCTTLPDAKETSLVVTASENEVIPLTLNDNGTAEVRISKKEQQVVRVSFESEDYKTLTGNLSSPDSSANIRFLQIIMPDGTMDGPFSRDIQYTLPMDGQYTLRIGENMMAGDPWAGEFKVSLQLSK